MSKSSPSLSANKPVKPLELKILVIGDRHTGKTSLIRRYVHKDFIQSERTVGADISTKSLRIDETYVKTMLWDIAGQERFIGLAPTYFRHAVAAVIVCDIADITTLDNAKKWKSNVDDKVFLRNGESIPVILFANKWDLVEMDTRLQKASDELLNAVCRDYNFMGWVSTSAKTGMNVRSGMNKIVKRVLSDHLKMMADARFIDNEIRESIDISKATQRPKQSCGVSCSGLSSITHA